MSDDQPDIWIEMLSKEDENLIIGFYYREFTGIDGDKSLEKCQRHIFQIQLRQSSTERVHHDKEVQERLHV